MDKPISILLGGTFPHGKLIDNNIIEYIDAFKTYEMQTGEELTNNNRVGAFEVKANSKGELLQIIYKAVDTIEVFDIKSKPIIRNNIYTQRLQTKS
jgi:hypothetical protein